MADSLIARLSTVPGLVVRSIGSVRRYAGADQDPLRAARDLDVAWIVDGSLQRRGDQLRVTARLLRAADGAATWSGSFDEKFTGVFDVQDADLGARRAGARAEPGSLRRRAPTADRNRRHAQHRRLPALSGRGSTRAGHARRGPAQEHRAVQPGAGHRPWVCLGLGGAGRNPSAHVVRRRRLAVRGVRARRTSRSSARWPSFRTWPKPVPSRPSSSIGSTSIGRAPNASFERARDQSERGHGPLRSGQPCC